MGNHFSKNRKSYIIEEPNSKRLWLNNLSNKDGYVAEVSNVGTGTSRYIDENAIQATLNERGERFIYIRNESGKCWNVGQYPLMEKVDRLLCEHSMGYTKIETDNAGINAAWTVFIPREGFNEVWILKLKNTTDEAQNLNIFPVLSFDLGGFEQPAYYFSYLCTETLYDEELCGIYAKNAHPFNPHQRYNGFLASSIKPVAYDGNLTNFYGALGSPARPQALLNGENCTGGMTTVTGLGAILQNEIELAAGEEKTVYYIAGLATSLDDAKKAVKKSTVNPEAELEAVIKGYDEKYGNLHTNTPDERVNNILNYWTQRQVDFCALGKKAVRDNSQIAMSLLNFLPDRAEATMTECLTHQYQDGHAVLRFSPTVDPILYADPHLWLVLATCELIKETGDTNYLNKVLPYQDGGEGTVFEHLHKAMEYIMNDLGQHGIPLIHYADWNDALNIDDENAESVFMAMGLAWAQKELSILCKYVGKNDYSDYLLENREKLVKTINEVAWDGEWYVRAFSKFGMVGSKTSEGGGNIYINPQVWSILADVVTPERLNAVIAAIDKMDGRHGIQLCEPAYSTYNPRVGRMSGMLPGLFENGGVYNHTNAFKIMADCKLGRGNNALATLHKMMPDGEQNPVSESGAEPYLFVNCWGMHPAFFTKIWFSWFTGTSGWALRGFYEGICGLKRSYEGLSIEPSIPDEWNELEVDRCFRGCKYHIVMKRENLGYTAIEVDGKAIEGNVLPLLNDDAVHNVTVKF